MNFAPVLSMATVALLLSNVVPLMSTVPKIVTVMPLFGFVLLIQTLFDVKSMLTSGRTERLVSSVLAK